MTEAATRLDWCAGIPVLRLSGEFDIATAPKLDQFFMAGAALSDRLIVDLIDVPFIDSSALGIFFKWYGTLSQREGEMALVTRQSEIRHLLERTGATRYFALFHEVEDAAVYLGASPEKTPTDGASA
jgi:anti-sigma B factor antagonist